ncbi:hypothetical protein [Dyadobacter sp. CY323]|uniref:hypothetical protein n=1 Tax=Dyadobacter sp. CY323 TaxID=2907302 RepID=UPI001F37FEAB|nr:hypothetical protein [Dyadobacter sp. CY323]MCE6990527.1 hypothetical protein [Dyadobacter sp. CY323]
MKLVQKLPIGLGLACVMMMTSCSKENAVTPEPAMESTNVHSSLKTNAEEDEVLPFFPTTTDGIVNFNSYPRYWERGITTPNDLTGIPTGTSSLTSLWGQWYAENKWIKPLAPVPSNVTANSMLTVRSFTSVAAEVNKRSYVFTTIMNLKPGKTYSATIYVATTITNRVLNANTKPVYAKSAEIKLYPYTNSGVVNVNVDLTGKEAVWVKKTITFTPTKSDAKFWFSGLTKQGDVYSYIHLFVDPNSVKEAIQVGPVKL